MTQQQGQPTAAPIRSEFADDPDMLELVEFFVQEMPERVQTLAECWRDSKLEDLESLAHQLKGASGGYGFEVISEAASRVERSLKDGDEVDQLHAQVDELIDLCRRVAV